MSESSSRKTGFRAFKTTLNKKINDDMEALKMVENSLAAMDAYVNYTNEAEKQSITQNTYTSNDYVNIDDCVRVKAESRRKVLSNLKKASTNHELDQPKKMGHINDDDDIDQRDESLEDFTFLTSLLNTSNDPKEKETEKVSEEKQIVENIKTKVSKGLINHKRPGDITPKGVVPPPPPLPRVATMVKPAPQIVSVAETSHKHRLESSVQNSELAERHLNWLVQVEAKRRATRSALEFESMRQVACPVLRVVINLTPTYSLLYMYICMLVFLCQLLPCS